MKVLMTADGLGGVWTYALELADALALGGVSVTLAVMGDPLQPGQRAQARASKAAAVHERPFRLEWMVEPWDDVDAAGEWLLQLERDVQPDVVHLNGFAHAALPWRAPVLVVAHSCVLSWWQAVRGERAPAEWNLYREAVERGLAAADAVVAPTRAMLDEVDRLYAPQCETLVIPNGRRIVAPQRPKRRFVLAAGRLWDEAKNLGALARVAPHLAWPVCVAGPLKGPDGQWAEADTLNLLGSLRWSQLAEWLGAASIFAAPARYEPFGLAPLEAAQARCALVLGDIPSLREVWGNAALYAPPGDDDALVAAIEQLVEDEVLRGRLAEAAFRRALEYTPLRMAQNYERLYRRLVPDPALVATNQEVTAP